MSESHVETLTADDAFSEKFPALYVRYIAERDGVSLAEAARRSFSRILSVLMEPERNAAVISAFRVDKHTTAENFASHRQLRADLRSLGWGYTPIIGGWVQEETGEDIEEHSFVTVANSNMPVAQFKAEVLKLVKKYDQDGALLKLNGDTAIYFLDKSGSVSAIGSSWSLDAAATAYTKMKGGGQRGIKFKFECASTDSVSTRKAVHYWAKNALS